MHNAVAAVVTGVGEDFTAAEVVVFTAVEVVDFAVAEVVDFTVAEDFTVEAWASAAGDATRMEAYGMGIAVE
jgi:hypothetical protein